MQIPDLPKIDTFIPSKADMEFCPLCDNKFTLIEESEKTGHAYFACMRQSCMVWIWVRDPMLGRWRRVESEQCPICSEKQMRLFFRQDGYIKMRCIKCGCCVENVDDEKHAALMKFEESKGERKTFKGLPTEDGK